MIQKSFVLSLTILICFIFAPSLALGQAAVAAQPGMPSIKEMFEKDTTDDLFEKMQMGQDMLSNMSPEELAEMEQAMQYMIENMSEDDWKELTAIVETIEKDPKFKDFEKELEEQLKAQEKQEKAAPVKPSEPVIEVKKEKKQENYTHEVSAVQKLAKEIVQLVKKIMLKASSKKMLEEYIQNNWADKKEFDLFVADIARLQDEKVATTFVQVMNKESLIKELYTELQTFKRELEQLESSFKVTDSFGLDDKKESERHMPLLKKITSYISSVFKDLKVSISKFFSLHVKEGQDKAKSQDDKVKKAKDMEIAHSKAKAPTTSSGSYNPGTGYGNNSYGSGSSPYYPSNAPASYNPYDYQYTPQSSSARKSMNADEEKFGDGAAKSNQSSSIPGYMPSPAKSEQEVKEEKLSQDSFDKATDALDEFIKEYDNSSIKAVGQLVDSYPQLEKIGDDAKKVEAMKEYNKNVATLDGTVVKELGEAEILGKGLYTYISNLDSKRIKEMQNSSSLSGMLSKVKEYEAAIDGLSKKHKAEAALYKTKAGFSGNNNLKVEFEKEVQGLNSSISRLSEMTKKTSKAWSGVIERLEKQAVRSSGKKEKKDEKIAID